MPLTTAAYLDAIGHHSAGLADAAGGPVAIAPAIAADAVDEFLDVSLDGTLDGTLELRALDTGDTWTVGTLAPPGPSSLLVAPGPAAAAPPGPVTDPATPGPTAVAPPPVLAATAAELLLWLYGRVTLDTAAVPVELLTAFRALSSTRTSGWDRRAARTR